MYSSKSDLYKLDNRGIYDFVVDYRLIDLFERYEFFGFVLECDVNDLVVLFGRNEEQHCGRSVRCLIGNNMTLIPSVLNSTFAKLRIHHSH